MPKINKKQTSKKIAKKASKILRDKRTAKNSKSSAGSVLSQVGNKKQTSKRVASISSKNLNSKSTSKKTKNVSASALAQAKKSKSK